MGITYSTPSSNNKIGIVGNGNVALMLNGVNYNFSSAYNQLINQIVEQHRLDLIRVHFVTVFTIFILILVLAQCFIPRHHNLKRNQSHNKRLTCSLDTIKHKDDFRELDKTLDDMAIILIYKNYCFSSITYLLHNIDDIYSRLHWSAELESVFIGKLIDKNFTTLCMTIMNQNDNYTLYWNSTWPAVSCALYSLNAYMDISQDLCQNAVDAGIVPLLVSCLSQTIYMENLESYEPLMFLFQTATRIFLHIAQIDKLKQHLEKYNCYEVLLNIVNCTSNDLLRAIALLSIAKISKQRVVKFPFTIHDSSIVFRLYYESCTSVDSRAFGIKQEEIFSGLLAIGQLESQYCRNDTKNL